ncbi:MAG: YrzE family protein [Myxococcota bacterium]
MAISHEQLIQTLEHRYDYHSARAVLERALRTVTMEHKALYAPHEVLRLCVFLGHMRNTEHLIERLQQLAFHNGQTTVPSSAPMTQPHQSIGQTVPISSETSWRHSPLWARQGTFHHGFAVVAAVLMATTALLFWTPSSVLPWVLVAGLGILSAALGGWIAGQRAGLPSPRATLLSEETHWELELDALDQELDLDRYALEAFEQRLQAAIRDGVEEHTTLSPQRVKA